MSVRRKRLKRFGARETEKQRLFRLQKVANRLGLNLWERAGFYLMTGVVGGRYQEGVFSGLSGVERKLDEVERYARKK